MVNAFSSRLNRRLVQLSPPPAILEAVRSNETQLAGLPIPSDVSPDMEVAIQESVAEAFVFGFRIVMVICAGLAVASSAVAWFLDP